MAPVAQAAISRALAEPLKRSRAPEVKIKIPH